MGPLRLSSILVVLNFGLLPFRSSSILIVLHIGCLPFGCLPFWSSSILVIVYPMVSVFHVILNGMYNYNSYIVGWHGIRPGQGGLSLTILPPVVQPQKKKSKRKKK